MQRKKLALVAGLLIVLMASVAYGAILNYYGRIVADVDVHQSVLVDGQPWDVPIEESFSVTGGDVRCSSHYLKSRASMPVAVGFERIFKPDGDGIGVAYFRPLEYEFTGTSYEIAGECGPIDITVVDGECSVTWTFDMKGARDLVGDGHWSYGIAISFDGETPNFLVHDNDGIDANFDWGEHLFSPYTDEGWVVSEFNIPVEDLSWVECTGDRYMNKGEYDGDMPWGPVWHEGNPDGIFTVSISKCVLGPEFYWGAWFSMGGFFAPYTYGMSQYPEGFDWEFMGQPSEHAELMEELPPDFDMFPGQRLDFVICYWFAPDIKPGTYTIITRVVPVRP